MRVGATLLTVIAFVTIGAACGTVIAPPSQTLPPVVLPDLSSLAPSVQQQVRTGHADLTRAIEANKAPADLAGAYGSLGRVLMAARFSDEAVLCYRHAESLAGTDPHWSYYLCHAYLRKGDRAAAARAFERAVVLARPR
jgi:tetratricopeptide (TPR) repeat protein